MSFYGIHSSCETKFFCVCGNVGNVVTWYVLVSLAFCLVSFGRGFYLDVSFWRLWCLLETMVSFGDFGVFWILWRLMVSFGDFGDYGVF